MLTPADKLRLPGGNEIIQIEITRKCDLFHCSNCTRLLPFRGRGGARHDPYEMSLQVFERAVSALADWPGVVALFGGNPCTHSEFPAICEILSRHVRQQGRRGLWTNHLRGHGEVVRHTFWPHGRFNLNVHGNSAAAGEMARWLPGVKVWGDRPSDHGAVIGSHADLGCSEAEWIGLREACDVNQKWSAAIVERDGRPVAYFCEVASALDGMRGEDHGLPAEPGWWRRPIADFATQVRECCDRACIVPLRIKGDLDRADTYHVTSSFVSLSHLQRAAKVKVAVIGPDAEHVREITDYQHLRAPS